MITDGARNATTGPYMALDICHTIDSRDLRFLNQEDHTNDAGFDIVNATVTEMMGAAQSGVIDGATAVGELGRRVPNADNADDRGMLRDSIVALKAMIDTGSVFKSRQISNGNLLKAWALAVKRATSIGAPLLSTAELSSLELADGTAEVLGASKAILQIKRAQTERIFDAALYIWSTLVHTLGIMQLEISSHFIFEVAYATRVKYNEDFWTTQEYLIDCLDLVDRGVCKASSVANHDRNLALDKARRLGQAFSDAAGKKGDPSGGPVDGGGKTWNGKCQPVSSKANFCQAFNRNKAHDNPKHLTSDGTCRFRHLCNHWVTDKGPSGRCLAADHGWWSCNNPNKCPAALE